jgi:hypothetical protein
MKQLRGLVPSRDCAELCGAAASAGGDAREVRAQDTGPLAPRRGPVDVEGTPGPDPERRLQERCSACHPRDVVPHRRRGGPGWHAVIVRKGLLNRARVDNAEQPVIARELARRRPAGPALATLDVAAAVLLAAVSVAFAYRVAVPPARLR